MTKKTTHSTEPSGTKRPSTSKRFSSLSDFLIRKIVCIRCKLTILTLVIIALITTGSSLVAIQIIHKELLDSMVKRGGSVALSAAIPAGFSILTEDRLALDNLAAKIEALQDDIVYLAILDKKGGALAHSNLSKTNALFETATGSPLRQEADFSMHEVIWNNRPCYEFKAPIQFAGSHVGNIIVGIETATLINAEQAARKKIILISLAVLAFASVCTFMLSKLLTMPIKRLASGVSQITAGNYQVKVKVTSKDELGELTQSFNTMSQMIMSQKDSLEGSARNLEESYISTIRILAAALDARDNYTLGHSSRVAQLSLLIGHRLGLNVEDLKDLEMSCFLHDIGKIHVPDNIINKPGRLSDAEYQIMKKHPEQGAEILRLAESLHKYIPAVLHHHEWYDGGGYPHGLQGDEIHIHAQIVKIADTYDAMTSSRPYRKGCSREEAEAEMKRYSGVQFNPDLVDLFLAALRDYENDETLFSFGGIHEKHDFLYTRNTAADGDSLPENTCST